MLQTKLRYLNYSRPVWILAGGSIFFWKIWSVDETAIFFPTRIVTYGLIFFGNICSGDFNSPFLILPDLLHGSFLCNFLRVFKWSIFFYQIKIWTIFRWNVLLVFKNGSFFWYNMFRGKIHPQDLVRIPCFGRIFSRYLNGPFFW